MRIGLFGGTFNPIHRGHLRAVEEIKKDFHLEQVFIIPVALPPHKTPVTVAGADDRLEMINLALDGLSGITASDVELRRPGPSYTIDTVRHFKQTFADDASIYLILGLDAFLEINTWKSYRQLLEQIACIVVARPDPDYPKARQGWEIMEKFVRSSISEDFEYSSSRGCYASEGKKPIYIRDIQALDISATQIRKKVKNNQPIENLVPPAVAEYIQSKGLYQ